MRRCTILCIEREAADMGDRAGDDPEDAADALDATNALAAEVRQSRRPEECPFARPAMMAAGLVIDTTSALQAFNGGLAKAQSVSCGAGLKLCRSRCQLNEVVSAAVQRARKGDHACHPAPFLILWFA